MTSHNLSSFVDVEARGRSQPQQVRQSVGEASARKVQQRLETLYEHLHDPEALRKLAAEIRQHALDHLDDYLDQAERNLKSNGVQVHWAETPREACEVIAGICTRAQVNSNDPPLLVKSKSMVSEEIHLNEALEARGLHPIETDLGEFVVQIDEDRPTHIVTPIIHKNRRDVAKSFQKKGLGGYTEDPETLTRQARAYLRDKFRRADIGITGANFVVAETGRIVIVTNEGNGRLCTVAPRIHIALTGIEKIIPREEDLGVLLKLLARSSTGQRLTVYTSFISGPRTTEEPVGPEEVHLVFLDNGRSSILGTPYREMLRCIRCGACLNVCPVYRQVTGHAYGSVYPGPMGAVLSPLLYQGARENPYVNLPEASSLCSACHEVCPVDIPIPEFLLRLRHEFRRESPRSGATPPFGPWAVVAAHPLLWRATLTAGGALGWMSPQKLPIAALRAWLREKDLPPWPEESFRSWWKGRQPHTEDNNT